MTGIDNTAAAMPDGARLLALDLATVSGTLEEISTTWRRAWLTRPELPLRLPLRLQDTARQLTADIRGLDDAGPGRALSVTSRLSALRDGVASAQAMTCGPGMPPAGDARLWDCLNSALRRASSRLPDRTSA
ncbi:MAG: hypothetical protein M0030_02310 [Actinomycetota bacterium]|nr:hypothetical protein [Actinomycetota bacterium]